MNLSNQAKRRILKGIMLGACAVWCVTGSSARAQQGEPREIRISAGTYVSSRPAPSTIDQVYDIVRVNRVVDSDNQNYMLQPAGGGLDEAVPSVLSKLEIRGTLKMNRDGGLIYGQSSGGKIQKIDLNEALTAPAAHVYSVHTTDRIVMGLSISGTKSVYDIAEAVRSPNASAADVVIISPRQDLTVERSTRPYDARVAGVISTDPKMYMGADNTKQPLALAGVVPCKVSAENGPVVAGDLLVTSSKPGHAMRAELKRLKPGMLVGRALESLPEGTGKINILINQ